MTTRHSTDSPNYPDLAGGRPGREEAGSGWLAANLVRAALYLAAAFLLLSLPGCYAEGEHPPDELSAYFRAFNAHDVEAVLALSAPEIRMYSVGAEGASVDIEGKDQLREWLTGYFSEYPNVRSDISHAHVQNGNISFIETATWGDPDDLSRQASLAVYRISGGLVRSAWYYY